MMNITILAVGKQKEPWMRQGMQEYLKRLGAYATVSVVEVEECRLPDNPSPAQIAAGLAAEGKVILDRVGKTPLVALCVEGRELSSTALAEFIGREQQCSGALVFVIGGSFGLGDEVKRRAVLCLSVSPMTFPHQLFRVLLAEQLYRAFSILSGGKYHK